MDAARRDPSRSITGAPATGAPSGSSTGSAVAVAARLCVAALGTENFGSINYPAQQNGIVGVKPTMGLVSRYGNVPTTYTLDVIGPMTGSVMDAAIVLGILAGRDEHDPATWTQNAGESVDYTPFLDRDGLSGAGIPKGAQIMAVADAYDAMTSSRPYRKGLPPGQAFKRILRDSGKQFAPDVVEAFQKVYKTQLDRPKRTTVAGS